MPKKQHPIKYYIDFYDALLEFTKQIKPPQIKKGNLLEIAEIAFLFRGIKYYKAILNLVATDSLYEAYLLIRSIDELWVLYFYIYYNRTPENKTQLFQIYYLHSLYEHYNSFKINKRIGKEKIKTDIRIQEKELRKILPNARKNLRIFCLNEMAKVHSQVLKTFQQDRKNLIFPEMYSYIMSNIKPSRKESVHGNNYRSLSKMLHHNFFNIYGTSLNSLRDNYSLGDILTKTSNSTLFLFAVWAEDKTYKRDGVFSAYKNLKIKK